jgi:hypothetical protein
VRAQLHVSERRACAAGLRDELLNGEIFYTLREAQIIESWRRHYNTIRPHASLGYKPAAPEVFVPYIRRVAGCATPTGSASHASATANLKLTFHVNHSAGADQLVLESWSETIASNRCRCVADGNVGSARAP